MDKAGLKAADFYGWRTVIFNPGHDVEVGIYPVIGFVFGEILNKFPMFLNCDTQVITADAVKQNVH